MNSNPVHIPRVIARPLDSRLFWRVTSIVFVLLALVVMILARTNGPANATTTITSSASASSSKLYIAKAKYKPAKSVVKLTLVNNDTVARDFYVSLSGPSVNSGLMTIHVGAGSTFATGYKLVTGPVHIHVAVVKAKTTVPVLDKDL